MDSQQILFACTERKQNWVFKHRHCQQLEKHKNTFPDAFKPFLRVFTLSMFRLSAHSCYKDFSLCIDFKKVLFFPYFVKFYFMIIIIIDHPLCLSVGFCKYQTDKKY